MTSPLEEWFIDSISRKFNNNKNQSTVDYSWIQMVLVDLYHKLAASLIIQYSYHMDLHINFLLEAIDI